MAIAHVQDQGMGGEFKTHSQLLLKPARDSKGHLIGCSVDKQGVPKCEFISQLMRVSDHENKHLDLRGVWVGAHPSLREKLAYTMLKRGLVKELGELTDIRRKVSRVCGTSMQVDFVVTAEDGTRTALEVKSVVDVDYNPDIVRKQEEEAKIEFWGRGTPYRRAAIFPSGGERKQTGPDGEKVVSARAIKRLDDLAAIQTGEKACPDGERFNAAILYVVLRSDARLFRPNSEACPSFAEHLRQARHAGVKVLAYRVAWGTNDEEDAVDTEGIAFFDGALKVDQVLTK